MLQHTMEPIHYPLTRELTPEAVKEAVKQFKNIMGYMRDRNMQYHNGLIHEVLSTGLRMPELRAELYFQVMKQLVDNPDETSRGRGWEVMGLMLMTFPPPETFENHLCMFFRKQQVHAAGDISMKNSMARGLSSGAGGP